MPDADVLTSGHTSDFINNATAGMQSSGLIPNFQLLLDNSITPQEFTKNVQAQYDKVSEAVETASTYMPLSLATLDLRRVNL